MDPSSDALEVSSSSSASQARPASSRPSLLPAFEPSPTSPSLPRPIKRKHDDSSCRTSASLQQYPTPIPTSSTNALPSSPGLLGKTRPTLHRTASTVSERTPLGTVPSIELPVDGEEALFGRSSNSSQHQLSANRLISRVHVKAVYRPADDKHDSGHVVIQCLGWNGAKIHCHGQAYELGKGDTFSSDKPDAEILLDVQDARVLIRWPELARMGSVSAYSDATEGVPGSPEEARTPTQDNFGSSPPQMRAHLESPVSPSPRRLGAPSASSTFVVAPGFNLYEDITPADGSNLPTNPSVPEVNGPSAKPGQNETRSSSPLSSVGDFSDRDEENDPIVHSFGPFGDNLLPHMASFQAVSPERRKDPLHASVSPKQKHPRLTAEPKRRSTVSKDAHGLSPIRNHVVNQLAFSRLHALPLSTIMNNLPPALRRYDSTASAIQHHERGEPSVPARGFNSADLKHLLDDTACVGEIAREGKDAAGKALEDEFYYVAELDTDEMRKTAVENSLGKPGLRNVRKQHKQYFWKRPRY